MGIYTLCGVNSCCIVSKYLVLYKNINPFKMQMFKNGYYDNSYYHYEGLTVILV